MLSRPAVEPGAPPSPNGHYPNRHAANGAGTNGKGPNGHGVNGWPAGDLAATVPLIPRDQISRYRILKVAPTSFFADYGCHVRILEEMFALQELGSQLTICTYSTGRDLPGFDIRRSLPTPWCNGVQVGSSMHKLYFDALLSLQVTWTGLWQRPDLVHAHLHEGALIGHLASLPRRVPLIFDFQGSLTSEMLDHNFLDRSSRFYRPLRWLESRINLWADAIITSSHNAAGILIEEFGYPHERVYPVPDGVNTERFRPKWQVDSSRLEELRAELGLPSDKRIVVYLGLLAEYQGSSHLLNAAAELLRRRDDLHFLIMGYPGDQRYRLHADLIGIGRHCTFTGRLPYEQAPDYLALGDVAVSPKVSETEGNGKLLNYMALGLPTATFDTPVSHEILGDLGVYAETGNASALAEAIELLLDEPTSSERSQQLRLRAEQQFSWTAAGCKMLAVYDTVCQKSGKC
ncbi:MAG: glycosyltransferase family 4 protein [Chloroflexi bacterium]|nr:glycosyltransferase family 4 protein [Chloroflexota bacterium]